MIGGLGHLVSEMYAWAGIWWIFCKHDELSPCKHRENQGKRTLKAKELNKTKLNRQNSLIWVGGRAPPSWHQELQSCLRYLVFQGLCSRDCPEPGDKIMSKLFLPVGPWQVARSISMVVFAFINKKRLFSLAGRILDVLREFTEELGLRHHQSPCQPGVNNLLCTALLLRD